MKTIIIIIASFLCVNLFAQHQAQFDEETPHTKVFKEVFNDSSETAQNGGTITDVTFSNGKGSFNGSSSTINYNKHLPNGNYSIRAKITTGAIVTGGNQYAIIGGGTNQFYIISTNNKFSHYDGSGVAQSTTIAQPNTSYDVVFTFDGTNVKIYVDGNLESTTAQNRINNELTYVGSYNGSTNYYLGTIDIIEFFNIVLTAEEVSNLYNDKRYEELNVTPTMQVISEQGVIEDLQGNSITNTDVTVFRDGSIWAMDFNGTTSELVVTDSSNFDASEGMTLNCWFKKDNVTTTTERLIIKQNSSNHSVILYFYNSDILRGYVADGTNSSALGSIVVTNNEWHMGTLTIKNGEQKLYLDGVLVNTGTSSLLDITFDAGTYIGNRTPGGVMEFDGDIQDAIVDDTYWSAAEVSQYYTSTKYKYRK